MGQKMNKAQQYFLDKLLNLESQNPEYKLKYEREVKVMLEEKLNLLTRIVLGLLALFGLFITIIYLVHLFKHYGSDEIDFVYKLIVMLAVFLFFILSVLSGFMAVRGKTNLALKSNAHYFATVLGVILGFVVITQLMLMYIIPLTKINPLDLRSILGTQLIFILFFLLITLTLCLILKKIYKSEVKTREKLLEIEYRIAEISDKLEEIKKQE
jgi:hypothetical protein